MPEKPKLTRRKRPSEADIQKVVNKGGSSIKSEVVEKNEDQPKSVQLRLYPDQIEAIDEVRAFRTGSKKVSRHAWIVEAIEEKVAREKEEFEEEA